MQEKINLLKQEFDARKKAYPSFFLKQGSFSVYYSKELDDLIKKVYDLLLENFFEEYLPSDLPFCVLASKAYSDNKICIRQSIGLVFVYKGIKAYNLKPMIKAFIALLNDLNLTIEYQILELSGLSTKLKESKFLSVRYLCGSKNLFKTFSTELKLELDEQKENIAKELFKYFSLQYLPFMKQEFNIKKDFGGIENYANLHTLLWLFKDGPKSFALNYIDEKELSELRLAMDFILSLQNAMNIYENKDSDILNLNFLEELAQIMQRKDKKHFEAREVLLQKSLNSMQVIGSYAHFLSKCLQEKDVKFSFNNLEEALNFFLNLQNESQEFDVFTLFALKRLKFNKKESEKACLLLGKILAKKHSFNIIKILFLSGVLKELLKPLANVRFLLNEESEFAKDEHALMLLCEFERRFDEFDIFKSLNSSELSTLKLSIILSSIEDSNEVSLANIYRFCALKLGLKEEYLALVSFKYFHILQDLIQKEDIYNETIIFALISKLENERNLRILYALTLLDAQLKKVHNFFYRSLEKLFFNALEGLEDVNYLDESSRRVKKELTLKRSKVFLELDPLMQDKITHIKSNLFIIKNSFEDIILVASLAQKEKFKLWLNNTNNLILELIVQKGFNLEPVLLNLSHLNLIFLSFFELFDEKIYIKIEYSNTISDLQKANLEKKIYENLHLRTQIKLKIPNIKKDELKFDFEYSKNYAKLNLNTKDQQGLMAFVIRAFNKFGFSLSAAKIQTIRQRTRNSFYFQKTPELLQKKQEFIKFFNK